MHMYMYVSKYVYFCEIPERMVIFLISHLKVCTVHKRNKVWNSKKKKKKKCSDP